MNLPSLPRDEVWPRTPEFRYRIYARQGDKLDVLAATPTPQGIGVALKQLDADERERGRRLVDRGAIGVLDAMEGYWLIMPWHKGSER